MDICVDKKIALIVGGSGDLGVSLAESLIAEGFFVILHYFRNKRRAISFFKKYGASNVMLFGANLADEAQIKSMIQVIKIRFPSIDYVINCAATMKRSSGWSDMSKEDWDYVLSINLTGIWLVLRESVPLIRTGGCIINVSSIYGVVASATEVAYSLSKAGVLVLSELLAKVLAPDIRVNAVVPGNIQSSMVPDTQKQRFIEKNTLLQRSATINEVVAAIKFLLSDNSSYITGTVLYVDGGFHLKSFV